MRTNKNTEGRVQREYAKIYKNLSEPEVAAFERKKARKRRARKRKRRLVLLLIALCFLLGIYSLLPISRIRTINIYQNRMIDSATILADSRIEEGKSMTLFLFDYFVRKNIQRNPFINDVTIEKTWNGTVNLVVAERWVVYKTKKADEWLAYFSDGTFVSIPETYDVDASVLIPIEDADDFPYDELAKNLAYVPREIVDKISEIKHNPSNLDSLRFMFYMSDRNRVSILMDNIKGMMKYYDKLVEKSNHERFEYVMEYTKKGIIGRKIND